MKILGVFLMVLPLLLIMSFMVKSMGWKDTLCIWFITLLFTALVVTGAYLITR